MFRESTADVRVWLTCVKNSQSVERHLTSYLKEAERFKKMIPGTMFIFIVFDLKNRRITTKRHTIGQLSAGHHSRHCGRHRSTLESGYAKRWLARSARHRAARLNGIC